MSFLLTALTALVLVVPVELPDKTFVATLVLATRYPGRLVWAGVVAAFGMQTLVAVSAGRLIALLPARPVHYVAAGLFAVGVILLVRAARHEPVAELEEEQKLTTEVQARARRNAVLTSFLMLFAAEWGDLSQLLTVGLVARGGHPVAVFAGAWVGLALVSGSAVLLGRVLLRYVSLRVVQYVGATVCAVLAVVKAVRA